ncbi:hypothetical protein ACFL15_01070 [Patescibacteria group bacterium]
MKKALTIALLIVVSISLTGCLKKKASEEELFSGSFFDLMKLGKNTKCTFSDVSEDGESEGTIYIAGKKSRNDLYASAEGGEDFESHTIIDGEWMYTWSNVQEQGTKMKLSEFDMEKEDFEMPTAAEMKEAYGEYQDVKKETNFKCRAWIPDNSKFNPPSDVEFVDMSQMMEDMEEQMTQFQEDAKSMCSMCDMMPSAEEKSECLVNLGCE